MKAEASDSVFSLGSNSGNRKDYIQSAIDWLMSILTNVEVSRMYSTPDFKGGLTEYMNAVVKGTTTLPLEELEKQCKLYEESCGRNADARNSGLVPIDIDVVIYKGEIIRTKDYKRSYFRIGYDLM